MLPASLASSRMAVSFSQLEQIGHGTPVLSGAPVAAAVRLSPSRDFRCNFSKVYVMYVTCRCCHFLS